MAVASVLWDLLTVEIVVSVALFSVISTAFSNTVIGVTGAMLGARGLVQGRVDPINCVATTRDETILRNTAIVRSAVASAGVATTSRATRAALAVIALLEVAVAFVRAAAIAIPGI